MTMPYHLTIGQTLTSEEYQQVSTLLETVFLEIDLSVNNWNSQSEISRFNQGKAFTKYQTSQHMAVLLTLCKQMGTWSEGRFDPTIAPLSKLWQSALKQGEEPLLVDLDAVRQSVGLSHLHQTEELFWKDQDSTAIDLCALSKGYCIDLISERLNAAGFKHFLVEWAGEMRAMGSHPTNRPWTILIEPAQMQTPLLNQAIATSGDYAQQDWGKGFFHMIDPLSGKPMRKTARSIKATTVIAPTCALADALATTLMLFPTKEEAETWAAEIGKNNPNINYWIFAN